jgi:hypothetical protein
MAWLGSRRLPQLCCWHIHIVGLNSPKAVIARSIPAKGIRAKAILALTRFIFLITLRNPNPCFREQGRVFSDFPIFRLFAGRKTLYGYIRIPVYFFISRVFSHLGNQRKSTFVLVGTHYFTKNTSYMVRNCSWRRDESVEPSFAFMTSLFI